MSGRNMQAAFRQRREGKICRWAARNAGAADRRFEKKCRYFNRFDIGTQLATAFGNISPPALGGTSRSSVMWFALGAASSILDGLQSLGSSKSTSGQSGAGSASSLFDFLGGSNANAATTPFTPASSGASAGAQIAPQT